MPEIAVDATPTEWAAVLSAVFAAAAAIASWVSIVADRKRQALARRPSVSAGFAVPPSRVAKLVFANGGPGLATHVGYFGVHRDTSTEFKYGGFVGSGFLQAGAETEVPIGVVADRHGTAEFVWFANDVDNNVHLWAYDGRYKLISSADYLGGRAPRKFVDLFRAMYPTTVLPDAMARHTPSERLSGK